MSNFDQASTVVLPDPNFPYQQIRLLIEDCLRQYMTQQETISYLTLKYTSLDRNVLEMRM